MPRTAKEVDEVVASVLKDISKLKTPTVPAVRVIFAKYKKELRYAPARGILAVARQLAKSNDFAPRLIGFEVLEANWAAMELVKPADIERWAKGLNDWAGVDLYGCTIVGQAWREGIITDALIKKWTKSPDRWLRRLSLVATVPLNNKARGGRGDVERTLKVCSMHLDDRDDMVVKALSWALRELAKRDETSVQVFIKTHEERLAGRVKREVGNKLRTGLKNPKS